MRLFRLVLAVRLIYILLLVGPLSLPLPPSLLLLVAALHVLDEFLLLDLGIPLLLLPETGPDVGQVLG